jgi:16S rRNA processing protein RimM
MMRNMIAIGKLLSTHGLRGGIKLNSYCEKPEEIFNLKLYDADGNRIVCRRIGNTNKDDVFTVLVNDINAIDDITPYKNKEIFVKREELPEIRDDEIYVDDLLRMKVMSEDETGVVVGSYNHGAGDIMEILWDGGEKSDIPFVERYIKKIDKSASTIYVEKPTYL